MACLVLNRKIVVAVSSTSDRLANTHAFNLEQQTADSHARSRFCESSEHRNDEKARGMSRDLCKRQLLKSV